jgi:hypothetical protein
MGREPLPPPRAPLSVFEKGARCCRAYLFVLERKALAYLFVVGSFSFLAGGSGKVLSRSVVEKLVKLPDPFARCKVHSDLDDAMLGSDLDQLNISLVHSDQFHQYR